MTGGPAELLQQGMLVRRLLTKLLKSMRMSLLNTTSLLFRALMITLSGCEDMDLNAFFSTNMCISSEFVSIFTVYLKIS